MDAATVQHHSETTVRWDWLHSCLESLTAKVDANHLTMIDLRQEVSSTKKALVDHVMEEEHLYKAALGGFPGEDPVGHRRYHEIQIQQAENNAKFWREMRTELGKHTLRGLLVVIGILIVYYWNGHIPSLPNQ